MNLRITLLFIYQFEFENSRFWWIFEALFGRIDFILLEGMIEKQAPVMDISTKNPLSASACLIIRVHNYACECVYIYIYVIWLLGQIIPTDVHIFQRGRSTTNLYIYIYTYICIYIYITWGIFAQAEMECYMCIYIYRQLYYCIRLICIYSTIYQSTNLPIYLSRFLSAYPLSNPSSPSNPSVHPSIYPSIYLSIYLFIYRSIDLSINLSTHLSTCLYEIKKWFNGWNICDLGATMQVVSVFVHGTRAGCEGHGKLPTADRWTIRRSDGPCRKKPSRPSWSAMASKCGPGSSGGFLGPKSGPQDGAQWNVCWWT